MTFIDIHCHINYYKDKEIEKIIEQAREKQVGIIVNNGTNKESNIKTLALKDKFPEIKAALGIYPIDALSMTEKEVNAELNFIEKNKDKIFAIGEVGIDLKESQDLEKQTKVFEKFIKLSKKINKPIVVHSRKAEYQVLEILEKNNAKKVIMHCFSGNMNLVKKIIQNRWFLSIPANVKYSEHFQNIIKIAPIENLFCETDSPYLHPDKKQNNTPENVLESYKKIAEIKSLDLKEVREMIYENFLRLQ